MSAAAPFVCPMPLRWSDQDLNAHVNNAKVITLFEEARIKASAHWFGGVPRRPRLVRSLTVDYRHPLHFSAEATAHVWISRIGTTSFVVHHEIHQEGRACVTGRSVMVSVHPETGKPEPLSDEARRDLEAALIMDAPTDTSFAG
ncbi:acyl-CoA thioesterase [Nesterenkonia suensis]